MKFGCCGSMVEQDGTGIGIIEALVEAGYDYIELSLSHVMALDASAFEGLRKRIAESGMPCKACNNFFPPRIRLTGRGANLERALAYAGEALARAAGLGADTVVFGSAGARNVPEGFPTERAWGQIAELLVHLDAIAARNGITIVVEPLNTIESNIVNTAREGLALVREVNLPRIQLLIDSYHLMVENEDAGVILEAGDTVQHVHFADKEGRRFLKKVTEPYRIFFKYLQKSGYDRKLSVEAYTSDFEEDASATLELMKELARA